MEGERIEREDVGHGGRERGEGERESKGERESE